MTTNASTDDCVRFIARVSERAGTSVSKSLFSSSSAFEEPRSWSWLKYRHKLRKLRASRIENIVHLQQIYIISLEWKITSSFILYHFCVYFMKGYLSWVTLSCFFILYTSFGVTCLIYSIKILFLTTHTKLEKSYVNQTDDWHIENSYNHFKLISWHHFKLNLIYFGLYLFCQNVNWISSFP